MGSTLFKLLRDALIAAAIDVAGPLAASKVGLYLNSPDLTDDTLVLADFQEPAATGYAQATPASWVAGVGDGGDPIAKPVAPITMTMTDAVGMPYQIRGWFVLEAVTNALQAAGAFPAPIPLTMAGQSITFTPVVPLGREMAESGDGFSV